MKIFTNAGEKQRHLHNLWQQNIETWHFQYTVQLLTEKKSIMFEGWNNILNKQAKDNFLSFPFEQSQNNSKWWLQRATQNILPGKRQHYKSIQSKYSRSKWQPIFIIFTFLGGLIFSKLFLLVTWRSNYLRNAKTWFNNRQKKSQRYLPVIPRL